MTINGINTELEWNASLHHVEFGFHDIQNASEWIQAANLPHFSRNMVDFKEFSIDMIFRGRDRNSIHKNESSFLATLLEPVTLKLDNYEHLFRAVMKDNKLDETVPRRWHKLTITFSGYEYGDELIRSGTGAVSLVNPGNLRSPARIIVTPSADGTNMTLTGACTNPRTGEAETVSFDTVTKGKRIELDGANGLFLEDGALKGDMTILSPPAMLPGRNTITCSDKEAALTVSVLPLYM